MKLVNFSKKISKNRDYAFNTNSLTKKKVMKNCENFFKNYGFCVLDNLVPTKNIKHKKKALKILPISKNY